MNSFLLYPAPSADVELRRIAYVPSSVINEVRSSSIHVFCVMAGKEAIVLVSCAGAVCQVTPVSVQVVLETRFNIPPTFDGLVAYRCNLADLTVCLLTLATLNFIKYCITTGVYCADSVGEAGGGCGGLIAKACCRYSYPPPHEQTIR